MRAAVLTSRGGWKCYIGNVTFLGALEAIDNANKTHTDTFQLIFLEVGYVISNIEASEAAYSGNQTHFCYYYSKVFNVALFSLR